MHLTENQNNFYAMKYGLKKYFCLLVNRKVLSSDEIVILTTSM